MDGKVGRRGALGMAHIAALFFGLTGIFGVLITTSVEMITFGRAAFAVLGLWLLLVWQGRRIEFRFTLQAWCLLLLAGIFLTLHWLTFFIAVKVGGVAVATLGFATFPAFITLIDHLLFKERVTPREWLLLLLTTIGLILVTPNFSLASSGTVGLLWGILSGFAFALLVVTNKRGAKGIDAIQVALWQNGIVVLLLAPFTVMQFQELTLQNGFYLALLGILCTGVSHYLLVKSLAVLEARIAGMIIALEPVYAILVAWWLFGSQPTLAMVAGAILIIGAILLVSQKREDKLQNSNQNSDLSVDM
ncbi:DMT family transporter [Ignatzschineria cameli]|uniref:DMT family transporter n=1 Tax=Ignatzschineria cameli TaxID=2182793 RepID=UPI000D61C745|nr:DMT family transporter [Ignatzschineria cameli]PWD86512.1 EamA family transporter [Ignatzschineria cameli]